MKLALVENLKRCSNKDCGQINPQPLSNFYKNKRQPSGLSNHCKVCNKIFNQKTYNKFKSKYNETTKAYRAKDRTKWVERSRKNWLSKKYGLTLEKWNEMFAAQKGECKICNIHVSELNKPLAVDHCHVTNKIRGLLCYHCNWLIGHARDNVETLKSSIKYLEEFK